MQKKILTAKRCFLLWGMMTALWCRGAGAQTAPGPASLLPNGDFESGLEGWSVQEKAPMSQLAAEAARGGKRGLRVKDEDAVLGSSALSQRVSVTPGQAYRLNFWARCDSNGTTGVYLWFYGADRRMMSGYQPNRQLKQSADWVEYTLLGRAPEGATQVAVWVHTYSTPKANVDFDDFALRPATDADAASLPATVPRAVAAPGAGNEGTPGATAVPRTSPPYILLKLDDLVHTKGRVPARWRKLTDFLIQRKVKAGLGIICASLEGDNPEFLQYLREVGQSGVIEYWNHGYDHKQWEENGQTLQEFKGSSYEHQKQHYTRSQELAKEKLGQEFAAFGAPFNGTDAATAKVLQEDAATRVWLYGDALRPAGKLVLDRVGPVNIENPLFVPSLDRFTEGYNRYPQREFFVIQGHPNQWDDARFEQFVKIVEFLQEQKAIFVTPSEYARMKGIR